MGRDPESRRSQAGPTRAAHAGPVPYRANELFAYLGSQVVLDGGPAPELEAYYARYFTDGDALVDGILAFESTLDGSGVELENGWADTGRS